MERRTRRKRNDVAGACYGIALPSRAVSEPHSASVKISSKPDPFTRDDIKRAGWIVVNNRAALANLTKVRETD